VHLSKRAFARQCSATPSLLSSGGVDPHTSPAATCYEKRVRGRHAQALLRRFCCPSAGAQLPEQVLFVTKTEQMARPRTGNACHAALQDRRLQGLGCLKSHDLQHSVIADRSMKLANIRHQQSVTFPLLVLCFRHLHERMPQTLRFEAREAEDSTRAHALMAVRKQTGGHELRQFFLYGLAPCHAV